MGENERSSNVARSATSIPSPRLRRLIFGRCDAVGTASSSSCREWSTITLYHSCRSLRATYLHQVGKVEGGAGTLSRKQSACSTVLPRFTALPGHRVRK